MMPTPLYAAENARPAYELRYGWTGWLSVGGLLPVALDGAIKAAAVEWEADALRLLEQRMSGKMVQLVLSALPHVGPVLLAARVKGRLQHALRNMGCAAGFSRKLAVRSVGHNHRADVERYIEQQVAKATFHDPAFTQRLGKYSVIDPAVDLSEPTETHSGRYWYNLHLVLVNEERYQRSDDKWLERILECCFAIGRKKGHAISRLSVMPDHLHMALRGNVAHSPQEIALAFQNNLAYAMGSLRVFQATYYVGTFGEYDMQAVRHGTGASGSN
jgi:REP element-mobilizing transposase RayT